MMSRREFVFFACIIQFFCFLFLLSSSPARSLRPFAFASQVARRWGIQKNRPAMNYDKLSRSLRYYYEKGIMQKVAGEETQFTLEFTFKS